MKIAPIIDELKKQNKTSRDKGHRCIDYILVHTGQHYDDKMSKYFFDDLGIPKPDINLEIGSSSHAVQTAEIMKKFETVCMKEKPSHVLVVGDVNSTIACALVACKMGIKVIHVEAGLRSFDRDMPEEINRVLTDAISDLLFTTEESALENLIKEGIAKERVYFVGNVMIDTLLQHRKKASCSKILDQLGLVEEKKVKSYGIVTLHRPSNVDNEKIFKGILDALSEISRTIPLIFPVHPRTIDRIRAFDFNSFFKWEKLSDNVPAKNSVGIHLVNPLGYLDFLQLTDNAKLVLTDSGGIQEETTILGVPCVTLRKNTERPITVTCGTNILVGVDPDKIVKGALNQIKKNRIASLSFPPLWDGRASERIVGIIQDNCR